MFAITLSGSARLQPLSKNCSSTSSRAACCWNESLHARKARYTKVLVDTFVQWMQIVAAWPTDNVTVTGQPCRESWSKEIDMQRKSWNMMLLLGAAVFGAVGARAQYNPPAAPAPASGTR